MQEEVARRGLAWQSLADSSARERLQRAFQEKSGWTAQSAGIKRERPFEKRGVPFLVFRVGSAKTSAKALVRNKAAKAANSALKAVVCGARCVQGAMEDAAWRRFPRAPLK